jgi:nucleoside 2-deoxyribosyltransferase
MNKMRVYVASASAQAAEVAMAQDIYRDQIDFVSDWPQHVLAGESEAPMDAALFWKRDLEQIDECNVLICWAQPQFRLRGAIFETGYAYGIGKTVILAGSHSDFHTWQYAPGIIRMASLNHALEFMIPTGPLGS